MKVCQCTKCCEFNLIFLAVKMKSIKSCSNPSVLTLADKHLYCGAFVGAWAPLGAEAGGTGAAAVPPAVALALD